MGRLFSIESVTRHADVSHSYLYGQPDLRAEIDSLRGLARDASAEIARAATCLRRLAAQQTRRRPLGELDSLRSDRH